MNITYILEKPLKLEEFDVKYLSSYWDLWVLIADIWILTNSVHSLKHCWDMFWKLRLHMRLLGSFFSRNRRLKWKYPFNLIWKKQLKIYIICCISFQRETNAFFFSSLVTNMWSVRTDLSQDKHNEPGMNTHLFLLTCRKYFLTP